MGCAKALPTLPVPKPATAESRQLFEQIISVETNHSLDEITKAASDYFLKWTPKTGPP
jgi:hypothetical protein